MQMNEWVLKSTSTENVLKYEHEYECTTTLYRSVHATFYSQSFSTCGISNGLFAILHQVGSWLQAVYCLKSSYPELT